MKVLVATDKGKWITSDILECEEGEIVIFPLFQSLWNINKDEIYMEGIITHKRTTTITVKDIKIPFYFYKELIKESIESKHKVWIEDDGSFILNDINLNLDDIINELLDKCGEFRVGDIIKVDGRQLYRF